MCLGLSSFRQKAFYLCQGSHSFLFILCSGPLQWLTLEPGNLFGVDQESDSWGLAHVWRTTQKARVSLHPTI